MALSEVCENIQGEFKILLKIHGNSSHVRKFESSC